MLTKKQMTEEGIELPFITPCHHYSLEEEIYRIG